MANLDVNLATEPSKGNRSRVRFSLRTLLLLALVAGSIILLIFSRMEIDRLVTENRLLRDELGKLTIKDLGKVHVNMVPSHEEYTWRWRVYLPDRRFRICMATAEIPEHGFPADFSSSQSISYVGEHTLIMTVKKDSKQFYFSFNGGGIRSSKPDSNLSWMKSFTSSDTGKASLVAVDEGKPVILLRLRGNNPGSRHNPNPCSGVMLWIDEGEEGDSSIPIK